ncbi:hypothetical protein, partial [Candidatus Magnetobacterium casense]
MYVVEAKRKDWGHAKQGLLDAWVFGYPLLAGAWLDADRVAKLYYTEGPKKLAEECDGEFTLIFREVQQKGQDETHDVWTICTSRYGMYSPWHDKDYVISPNLGDFINGKSKLNPQTALEYLSFGYGTTAFTVSGMSHIEGVRQFPPATIIKIEGGQPVSQEAYWKPFHAITEERIDKQWARERFNKQVEQALESSRAAILPITGGKDTRTLLSAYVMNGSKPSRAWTHVGDKKDTAIAAHICKHYHIPHIIYDDNSYDDMDFMDGMVSGVSYRHMNRSAQIEFGKGDGVMILGTTGNEIWRARLTIPIVKELQKRDRARAIMVALCTSIYFPLLPLVYTFDPEYEVVKIVDGLLSQAPK